MATITSSNSVFMLVIAGLFPVPQQLQGYSADAAFETEAADVAEVVLGVDGIMSAGYVPYLVRQTISLMPDSASASLFETWQQAQKAAQEIYYANGEISMPSVSRRYILTNGVVTSHVAIPGARRVLQARNFIITWGDVSPVPI